MRRRGIDNPSSAPMGPAAHLLGACVCWGRVTRGRARGLRSPQRRLPRGLCAGHGRRPSGARPGIECVVLHVSAADDSLRKEGRARCGAVSCRDCRTETLARWPRARCSWLGSEGRRACACKRRRWITAMATLDLVEQFQSICTDADEAAAVFYLEATGGNLEHAINMFAGAEGAEPHLATGSCSPSAHAPAHRSSPHRCSCCADAQQVAAARSHSPEAPPARPQQRAVSRATHPRRSPPGFLGRLVSAAVSWVGAGVQSSVDIVATVLSLVLPRSWHRVLIGASLLVALTLSCRACSRQRCSASALASPAMLGWCSC